MHTPRSLIHLLLQGGAGFGHQEQEQPLHLPPESVDPNAVPNANLSNRLNPNNVHFDRDMAAHYKALSKADKEMLWARHGHLPGLPLP